jgi:hypothetical protein
MRKLLDKALTWLGLRPIQIMPHMTTTYRVESPFSVLSENDMLAELGLDTEVEEDASLTYVFQSPSGEEELSRNYSRHRPLLAVSMKVRGEEILSIENRRGCDFADRHRTARAMAASYFSGWSKLSGNVHPSATEIETAMVITPPWRRDIP